MDATCRLLTTYPIEMSVFFMSLIHHSRHHYRLTLILRHTQIAHQRSSSNGPVSETPADFIHRIIQRLPLRAGSIIIKHIQLDRPILGDKVDTANGEGSDGLVPSIVLLEQNQPEQYPEDCGWGISKEFDIDGNRDPYPSR